jgi:hypothetical protein
MSSNVCVFTVIRRVQPVNAVEHTLPEEEKAEKEKMAEEDIRRRRNPVVSGKWIMLCLE